VLLHAARETSFHVRRTPAAIPGADLRPPPKAGVAKDTFFHRFHDRPEFLVALHTEFHDRPSRRHGVPKGTSDFLVQSLRT
jgi:hypothetical protein